MTFPNLSLKSKEFRKFLNSLAKINDTSILEISKNNMYSISASEDRSLFLWANLKGDFGIDTTLNLPSLTKLSNTIDIIGSNDISFKIASNKLEYRDSTVKFDYHLYDEGILNKPKVTLAKIQSLTYDYVFEASRDFIKLLLKNSSIFKGTNKLYIYTEDSHLVWSLADRTMTNSDNLTIVGVGVEFEMDEFILNLDNIRLLDLSECNTITFYINKNGIGKISLNSEDLELNYIVTSLTK